MSIFAGQDSVINEIKNMQLGARPKIADLKESDVIVLVGLTTNDDGETRVEFKNKKNGKKIEMALISFAAMRLCEVGAVPEAEWSLDLRTDDRVFNIQDLIAKEKVDQLVAGAEFTVAKTVKVVNLNASGADNVPTLTNMSYTGFPEFQRNTRVLFSDQDMDPEERNNKYNDMVSKLQATEPKKPAFLTETARFVTMPVFTIAAS